MEKILTTKLRKESSVQYSGKINIKNIPHLKERHYFTINIALDGDAPKQYIKAYFYYKNCPRASKLKSWDKYFCKFGGKSYPHESVIEYSINKIGEFLGLRMNETKLVIANGQIRFLSKDFIKKGKKLIHGIEILSEYFEDKDFVAKINENRKERRGYFTFEEIEKAIIHVYSKESKELLNDLVKLITFDAILGNNDRHFYNWGVIGNIKKEDIGVCFSPIYDSSRGLLWNTTEKNVFKMFIQSKTDKNIIKSYISKSKPRFSFDDNPKSNHFELIEYLINYNKAYKNTIQEMISEEKENIVLEKMEQQLQSFFSKERFSLMKSIIRLRFNELRKCT